MILDIKIDKNSDTKIYKQVAVQIRDAIEKGVFQPGDPLPTERELACSLKLARGTINKAYEELRRDGIIQSAQGRGSFVTKDKTADTEKSLLISTCVEEFLTRMESYGTSLNEIQTLLEIAYSKKDNRKKTVNIATIDCNEESLSLFREQFSYYENVNSCGFLLDEITKFSDPEGVLSYYNLIITTQTHFEQVTGLVPALRDRIFKVAVAPTQETIVEIATVPRGEKLGMIVKSETFKSLMQKRLESMNIDVSKVRVAFEGSPREMDRLLLDSDILLIPNSISANNEDLAIQLHYFKLRGGRVINFEYQIERGSLIYIEEQIKRILSGLDNF
ncbi:MAG: GntR family transcriptional regulator [Eubacteriales bacterium]|nr:GntR family transcriptional regulator [Eubacteriales bacterium]